MTKQKLVIRFVEKHQKTHLTQSSFATPLREMEQNWLTPMIDNKMHNNLSELHGVTFSHLKEVNF